ncbi:hypothetical protein KKB44_04045 [Candidatus Micrarchaeota archaeon]|nr:hypothetical protein [Candidatus Micrarchaeota archaeon]
MELPSEDVLLKNGIDVLIWTASIVIPIIVEHNLKIVNKFRKAVAKLSNAPIRMRVIIDYNLSMDFPSFQNKMVTFFSKEFGTKFRKNIIAKNKIEIQDGSINYLFHYLGDDHVHFETTEINTGISSVIMDFNKLASKSERLMSIANVSLTSININLFLPKYWCELYHPKFSGYTLDRLQIVQSKDNASSIRFSKTETALSAINFSEMREQLGVLLKIW